ncbi:MAG: aminodeoxychorismate/anthranilate synthase component II [Planctomycetota bacterium]|nr:MAG: aminodeoxychorismate/anthranilate synthase component II [Planctomycetota bacterium]
MTSGRADPDGRATARVVLVDQRDSFTHNLAQLCASLGAIPRVVGARELDAAALRALEPTHVILGPGPGHPSTGALALELFAAPPAGVAILGVCLGHQQLALACGARIARARELVHGRTSSVAHDGRGVFADVPSPLSAMRYHSLAVDTASVAGELEVSARSADGEVMGLRHRARACEGVQFHPESFLTASGRALLDNFIRRPWRGARAAAEN